MTFSLNFLKPMKSSLLRTLSFVCIGLGLIPSLHADVVDLTPSSKVDIRPQDGVFLNTYMFFKDGKRNIQYLPPRDWTWSGGGSKLTLFSRNEAGVRLEIMSGKMALPKSKEELGVKLKEMAKQTLLPSAEFRDWSDPNFYFISMGSDADIAEIKIKYTSNNENFTKSIAFYQGKDGAFLQWIVTAPDKKFEEAFTTVRSSIFSWVWM